jgi:predicted TIM-barrel fold metal-dependent hydrolase
MATDMHFHWVPPELAQAIRKRAKWPRIERDDSGQLWLDNGGKRLIRVPEGFEDDASSRVAVMDKIGIQHSLLSLSTIFRIECLPREEALELCKLHNDGVSRACAAFPDRLSALAVVPAADMSDATAEFERAMTLPGIVGALLLGDGFLSEKRAQRYAPVFRAADRRDAILMVHYGYLPDDPEAPKIDISDNAYVRVATLDFQARISSNLVTLVLTDFLKAYPNVIVLSHNLGGNIPFEIERMDHRSHLDQPKGTPLPSQRFRDAPILIDCNSFGPRALELAVSVYGADKIVLGSDGSAFGAEWSMNAVRDANLSEADKRAILNGNADAALARARKSRRVEA